MRRQPSPQRANRGFALLALFAFLIAGVLYFVVTSLGPDFFEAYRARKTEAALAQARDALIGYALQYRDRRLVDETPEGQYAMYGPLPMPDLGESTNRNGDLAHSPCFIEGCAKLNINGSSAADTYVGRLPWRTLGTEPIRDGYGECLWYAVSANHKNINSAGTINWDTLGQLDVVVADSEDSLLSIIATAHDRPVAIIFSPGPITGDQKRERDGPVADDVTECGGNYKPANYLDPSIVTALRSFDHSDTPPAEAAYYDGSVATNTSSKRIAISTSGRISFRESDGKLFANTCPAGTNCPVVANDVGLPLTPDLLFGAMRKNANFRIDINSMLDRIVGCLRDKAISCPVTVPPNPHDPYCQIPADSCYADDIVPRGYFSSYNKMTFVAMRPSTVNGEACAGALLFANQRAGGQSRITDDDKKDPANNLEGINAESYFLASGVLFSGSEQLERVSPMQTISQDIVRCIPSTRSFVTTTSPGLDAAHQPQLVSYTPATGTLTLGQPINSTLDASLANFMYGCAWRPEAHAMNGGLRSYFTFRINDLGFSGSPHEGFTLTLVDGDNNSVDACGAAAQHLGYSGNNTETPFVVPPKVGVEIDLRRIRNDSGFNPSQPNHLANGRNDPSGYRGGHVTMVYWGGETPIDTTLPPEDCVPPAYISGGLCYLPQEEDDNVHGRPALARSSFAPPPEAPSIYHSLDPNSVPVNRDFHVRVELTRTTTADFRLPQVRVATTASIDLSHPYALIDGRYQFVVDGIHLFDGDRVLVKNQLDTSQNGVYVWHTAPAPMSRAADASSAVDLAGLTVEVQQGIQNAHTIWRQNNTNAEIGTDPLTWTNTRVKIAAPASTNRSSPGATLDGIQMKPGDRVFIKTVGVYVWHSASSPMTPAPDINAGSAIQVQQGSEAPSWWRFDGTSWQPLLVRTATQAPLDLTSPGATIGGVALVNGDRVLVSKQSHASENGIYIWNGGAATMTRAADADSAIELAGALTQVREGNDAGRAFRQTTMPATSTLETQSVQWEAIDGSPNYLLEVWILRDSESTNMRNAMQDTTRPMSMLYPSFIPKLRSSPVIPYPFRNVRLGFTTGQRNTVTDQTITIMNSFTSWLP